MRLVATALCALVLCGFAQAANVTVFAAASLKEAMDDAAQAFRSESGHTVRVSYGASSTLAKQIEAGAPAELFMCADDDWMRYLAARGLVDMPPVMSLGNALVLIVPAARVSSLRIEPGFALGAALGRGRLALADPDAVPAGKYARASLQSLRAWDGVRERLAPAENVRAALAMVARSEAPFGIVYSTDAQAEPRVAVVGTFPASSHPPILYPVALVHGAPPAADQLARFLGSPRARDIFLRRGFTLPPGDARR